MRDLVGGHFGDVTAFVQDLAGAGARLAEDRHHQRRLAGTVGADQRHDLAGSDFEVDALQRLDLAVGGAKAADREQGSGRRHDPPSITAAASSSSVPREAAVPLGSARTSRGEPSEIFTPWSITTMWSEISITTDMSCSISRIEVPSSLRIDSSSSLRAALSRALRPAAGSSRHKSAGSVHIARAISSRRWSP